MKKLLLGIVAAVLTVSAFGAGFCARVSRHSDTGRATLLADWGLDDWEVRV